MTAYIASSSSVGSRPSSSTIGGELVVGESELAVERLHAVSAHRAEVSRARNGAVPELPK